MDHNCNAGEVDRGEFYVDGSTLDDIINVCLENWSVVKDNTYIFDLKVRRDRGVTDGEGEAVSFYKGGFWTNEENLSLIAVEF